MLWRNAREAADESFVIEGRYIAKRTILRDA